MKKTIIILIMIISMIAFIKNTNAEENNNCEKINTADTKTVEIKINQTVINQDELTEEDRKKIKLNYKILDLNNNVLDETTNDEENNIVFHCFTVSKTDIGTYKLYKIIMENDEKILDIYDSSVIYFSLRPNETNGLFDPIIAFYKDDNDDNEIKYNYHYKKEIFHATEEELQGQAYAVVDREEKTLTFFRDEPNKYTNKQEIGNKRYYTGFEEYQIQEYYSPWSGGWEYDTNIKYYIKKIIFKDAIKPKSITGWFDELNELEEIDISKLDTSLLIELDYFLHNCPKLKSVDISTMDVSNVNSLFSSFNNTAIEYLDFTVWNLNQDLTRVQMSDFGRENNNLKYLNISNFGDWSSSAELGRLGCLEKIIINDKYDFYRASMLDGNGPDAWYNPIKNETYTAFQIRDNLHNHTLSMAGSYIRPMCTTNTFFLIKAKHQEVEQTNNITNPKTGNKNIYILLILLLSLYSMIFLYRKKHKKIFY